ncbi:MAG TPA: zinc-ribbon domain-containing protein [Stellaceae bacterium]|jgi:predicted Zn finger-like uncharacterized protein
MIVTCSNCSKRYVLDPRALGAAGRRVRCANCQHTWFVAAPDEAAPAPDAPPLEPPAAEPSVTMRSDDNVRRIQLPAVAHRSRGARWLRRGAIAALVLLIVWGVWGLVAEREIVMNALPETARVYALLGLGPTAPGFGLELRQVTPSRGVENGVPTLTIDGVVTNISGMARPVPKLRVALRDASNKELQSWTVAVTDQPLAPDANAPFHTTIQQPPDAATGVVVSFAPAGG